PRRTRRGPLRSGRAAGTGGCSSASASRCSCWGWPESGAASSPPPDAMTAPPPTGSLLRGRLLILSAAVLWSLSGVFIPLLRHPTRLGLHQPEVLTWHIAFYRIFFAGVVLVPTLRRPDITWRPAMFLMTLAFAAMNLLLMTAMAQGKTSDAILLQYTAPMWLYLFSVSWLGEPADRRGFASVLIGLLGIVAIV